MAKKWAIKFYDHRGELKTLLEGTKELCERDLRFLPEELKDIASLYEYDDNGSIESITNIGIADKVLSNIKRLEQRPGGPIYSGTVTRGESETH